MSLRKVPHVPGEFYHIYNRGNSKQKIFRSDEDCWRFIKLLYLANGTLSLDLRMIAESEIEPFLFEKGEPRVAIGAYCLMPNHFHILLTPLTNDGVASFMKKLATAYSMYFNTKYYRTGTLFEGRYKSEHVAEDRYLKYLFAYIHLNPVKLFQNDWREVGLHDRPGAQAFLDSYPYSSHLDGKTLRPESAILNRTSYPNYFESKSDIDKDMLEWMTYHQTEITKSVK
jgi:REP element-mobilizing transposase RayT